MAGGTETQLERTLGFWEALTIGVGTMVGAGIFVLPGPAAALAGPAAAVAFVAAGGIAVLTALSASELATAMPASGGPYHFINRGLGPVFGSIAGLGNWLGLTFATAFYAVGFGNYVAPLVIGILPPLGIGPLPLSGPQLGGLVAAVLFIGVNYLSTKGTGDLQNVIVIVLLGILGLFILLGVTQADVATLRPLFPEGPESVFPATALVFVSYLGFAQVATVAGEIKQPGTNLPRAMVGGVLLVTAVYAVSMVILLGVVERTAIAGSGTAIADGAAVVFGAFGSGVVGVGLLTFGGLLATASSANASVLSASRINYAMGRDGLMDARLSAIHAVRHATQLYPADRWAHSRVHRRGGGQQPRTGGERPAPAGLRPVERLAHRLPGDPRRRLRPGLRSAILSGGPGTGCRPLVRSHRIHRTERCICSPGGIFGRYVRTSSSVGIPRRAPFSRVGSDPASSIFSMISLRLASERLEMGSLLLSSYSAGSTAWTTVIDPSIASPKSVA
jgi:L-asparagine transporter-like permease